jgi:molybdopterin-guanine dinucleotide biosynthesis protein A
MKNRFAEMDCFVLAGGRSNVENDFKAAGELTHLEKGYRRYATVFEKVKLVLKKEQATEKYLNYPHICDEESDRGAVIGIKAALKQAGSEPIFIGSSDLVDFPLELAVELVNRYDGELFLGYCDASQPAGSYQPLFGVFSRELVDRLQEAGQSLRDLSRLLARVGKLMPLPSGIPADRLGIG